MSDIAIDIDIILRRIEGSKSNGKDVVLVEHEAMLRIIDHIQRPHVHLVKAGSVHINPNFVASMTWDQRHYMNGPGDSVLIVRMMDGDEHRIKHQPHLLDGVDAYKVEKALESGNG